MGSITYQGRSEGRQWAASLTRGGVRGGSGQHHLPGEEVDVVGRGVLMGKGGANETTRGDGRGEG